MSTDDELTAALPRALDGAAALAPDPVHERLAAGARRSGLRRQRRHVAAATGALAVAVLGAAAGFSAAGYGRSGADAPAASRHVRMSEQRFNELLTRLLPKGTLQPMDRAWTGGRDPHEMGSMLVFDDGAGASMLQIQVQYTGDPVDRVTCVDGFDVPSEGCERTVQPDGSVLVVDRLRSVSVPGLREWHGIWAAPDGRQVRLTEYNGRASTPVRDAPPLTEAQLAALVTSPLWTEAFAALTPVADAPDAGAPADARPSLSAEGSAALLDKLTPLLPAGTAVDVRDPAHTRLGLTADGRHSSLMVTYEPPSQRGLDELAALPQTLPTPLEVREPLPGGGTVVVNAFGNGKTATDVLLHWVVTVHYPDGAVLLLDEWNGEQFHAAAPGTPALDLAALKAVALSPSWRS
ncbi:hypothetical protein [Kitasatospora phosalacinea]|uniref:DUF4367 domain-containing protein n=1 Tax=Kitasatospora phosalacinea TaxID=2065 RepID=A0A9W6UQB0_9ACTN|nr:hypothetical protein [Kitasatospora phosalacinea]GLW56939.1 hypothetical protein Kpho01_49500 [Kitasatospora phosalacinea]